MLPPLTIGLWWVWVALLGSAEARNNFSDFTKAPTFDPPEDCVPTATNYGVVAQCEIEISNGRYFWASMDTAVGWSQKRESGEAKEFARDHVAEAKAWWRDHYPLAAFASEESVIMPQGAPLTGIECFRYSVLVDGAKDQDSGELINSRVEGLSCAWLVDNPKEGKPTVELFWLEAFDVYTDSQEPLQNFQGLAKKIFSSART
jgi:hypothetical protein